MANLIMEPGYQDGYLCFKTYYDRNGKPFPNGGHYVVFRNGALCAEKQHLSEANKVFRSGAVAKDGIRLEDYLGIPENCRTQRRFNDGV